MSVKHCKKILLNISENFTAVDIKIFLNFHQNISIISSNNIFRNLFRIQKFTAHESYVARIKIENSLAAVFVFGL